MSTTINTIDAVACMFQDDVTLTINDITYNLPANIAIGVPDDINFISINETTKAITMIKPTYNMKHKKLYHQILHFMTLGDEISATVGGFAYSLDFSRDDNSQYIQII